MAAEMKEAFSAYFVTLTYTDQTVPRTDNGTTHNFDDHKEFIKQLKYYEKPSRLKLRIQFSLEEWLRKERGVRINRKAQKLKYFGVCEYGGQTGRTHWHYIIFNLVDVNNITRAWTNGRVHVDECNINTIDYTLKYMLKNDDESKDDTRERSKSFMSKGIGEAAADAAFIKFISETDNNTLGTDRGSIIGIPRYYRKKYLTEEQRKAKGATVAKEVVKINRAKQDEIIRVGGDPAQRDVTQAHLKQKQLNNQKKRKL